MGPCLPALGEQRGQSSLSHVLSPASSSSSEFCLIYSAGNRHISEFPGKETKHLGEHCLCLCYDYYPSPLFIKKSQLFFFSLKVSAYPARSSHIKLLSPKRCRQSPVYRVTTAVLAKQRFWRTKLFRSHLHSVIHLERGQ